LLLKLNYNIVVAFQVKRLYKLFIAVDCLQLEVNPLALTPEGLIYTADAKLVTTIQV
jgi:succinyl-CoA synthetase beta subunit